MSNNSLMVSFDIKSLFTNVPVDEALQVIRIGLEDDDLLVSRTMLSVDSIIELLTLRQRISHMKTASTNRQTVRRWVPLFPPSWLTYTWNSLNKKHWNLTYTKPDIWLRYVDDTFILWPHNRHDVDNFLNHLNSIRPSIQFTMEME